MKEEESVSIAVRHEQPISEAPSNVYVITDEDIRQSGATDIPTVLRRIPGMEVMQVTGADFNVSVRGDNQLQANKLLVMVDGRSIYLEGQGIVLWKLLPVTLPEIKRIEVLKGPASALYGFNAFDGVVNIITKSPQELKGTTLQIGAGELGTLTTSAIHAGVQGKFGYRLSVGEDQNQQWRNRDSLAFRAYKFNVLTEYALSPESKLSASGGLIDSNRFDGPIVATVITSSRPVQGYANVAYERPNLLLRAWWSGFDNTGLLISNPLIGNLITGADRDLRSVNDERNDVYNVDAQHSVTIRPLHTLTYGINYRHIQVSSNFLPSLVRQNRLGLFVQDEWKATRNLSLVTGVRYDLHTEINATISPRLALLYAPVPDHTFRLAFSIAYRPPTPFETGNDIRAIINLPAPFPSPPPTVVRGSENLHPEKIISYELGYQGWLIRHRLRVRADLFFNHLSDLIGTLGTVSTNQGQADIYGGEAGMDFQATTWLSGFANYSYQVIGQTLRSDIQRGAPRVKVNAGFRAEWDNGVNGEVAVHHVDSARYPLSSGFSAFTSFGVLPPDTLVGSYTLLNVRAGYRFWREKAEVAVSAFNSLNDRHKEHPLGDIIGSRVMGWLTLKF